MARPRKAPHELRDTALNPRLTTAERARIQQHAAAFGISASEFMRRRALSYRLPAAVAEQQHTAQVATALIRLGVNLNQIAKHMNAGRSAAAEARSLAVLLARIEGELDQLYGPGSDGGRAVL